ncbi:MAG TPA: SDR family NAD(P)-dependent oxidoreductase [Gemmatimonadaceae bacterium]|nr:SDR family NAD(P)-dependent oxidoreductase [Gemmatimonadaceae bacterium]
MTVLPELSLRGRRALVTGASRGIGLAIARALAARGAAVALMARSADAVRAHATALGPQAHALPCDLSDADAVARAARQAVEQLGGEVEVLVSNAGLFRLARVEDAEPADVRATLETNLLAPFLLLRMLLPAMRRAGTGHVVTIGSIADRAAFPENGAYAASKFGARALHQVVREELRGSGVRATLVSPGPTDTELWDAIDPDARPGFTPRAAMLPADAVADAVVWALTRPMRVNVDELRLTPA